eukprot:6178757-Pleurochrysis_carterae.AAC.4
MRNHCLSCPPETASCPQAAEVHVPDIAQLANAAVRMQCAVRRWRHRRELEQFRQFRMQMQLCAMQATWVARRRQAQYASPSVCIVKIRSTSSPNHCDRLSHRAADLPATTSEPAESDTAFAL